MYMPWCNVEACPKNVWVFHLLITRNKLSQEKPHGVKNIYTCRWF